MSRSFRLFDSTSNPNLWSAPSLVILMVVLRTGILANSCAGKEPTSLPDNYDLATHPSLSEIGLSLFMDFLEFPAYQPQLLSRTQERMIQAAGSPSP